MVSSDLLRYLVDSVFYIDTSQFFAAVSNLFSNVKKTTQQGRCFCYPFSSAVTICSRCFSRSGPFNSYYYANDDPWVSVFIIKNLKVYFKHIFLDDGNIQ